MTLQTIYSRMSKRMRREARYRTILNLIQAKKTTIQEMTRDRWFIVDYEGSRRTLNRDLHALSELGEIHLEKRPGLRGGERLVVWR